MRNLLQKLFVLTIIFNIFFTTDIIAQGWEDYLPESRSDYTFFDYQKAFSKYEKANNINNGYIINERGEKTKVPGWKLFKRWEYEQEKRINQTTGEFPKTSSADEYQKWLAENPQTNKGSRGAWTSLHPPVSGFNKDRGRLNCISFHPTDNNTYWVGSPSGGIWRTSNNGANWTVLNDDAAVLGVSDIAVSSNYASDQTLYIATGDKDGGSMSNLGGQQSADNNSIGVLKSTNGGTTWSTTGLTFAVSDGVLISKVMIDPGNNNILYASTTQGIYKTTNAGNNWTHIYNPTAPSPGSGEIYMVDMEFRPGTSGNSLTIFASSKEMRVRQAHNVHMSIDAGATWTTITNHNYWLKNLRIDIAVSPANPDYLYAIIVNQYKGLYRIERYDINAGSWTRQMQGGGGFGYALLNYDSRATGINNGQGTYDLAIAVSPSNAEHVFVGGINVHKSTTGALGGIAGGAGGGDWTCSSCYTDGIHNQGSPKHPVTYADTHMLKFRSNGDLFQCNDGGVFISTDNGLTWDVKTGDMAIGQLYRLGVSQTQSLLTLTGLQDNGTRQIEQNGNWRKVGFGDGMEALIDYTDENVQYAVSQQGVVERTTNNWVNRANITYGGGWINGIESGEKAAWVTPFIIDPVDNNTLYIGLKDAWKSTDRGDNWTKILDMHSLNTIRSLAVAPSNTNYIYAARQDYIWVTKDGGATAWGSISTGLPTATNNITYITVKDNDPSTAWVTFGGYDGNRIFKTTDAGQNWTNISAGLPNLPVLSVVQNKLSTADEELYVATDVGVYMKFGTANWVAYGSSLPNVLVNELDIYYDNSVLQNSRLRAATGGRGLWETELNTTVTVPVITTTVPFNITASSAQSGGNIFDEGIAAVTERGIVWSTNLNPTISNNKIIDGATGAGTYTSNITGLSSATTYHVRAYAINSYGIEYGQDEAFTTPCGTFFLPYDEDFDSGTETCWTSSSEGTVFGEWLHAVPSGLPPAHDGACFITNGNNNYGSNAGYVLTSPIISLSGYKDNIVTFDMWLFSEAAYDGGFMECYDGIAWVKINNAELSINYNGVLQSGSTYAGEDAYSGDHRTPGWREVTITLPTAFNNVSDFQIRYKFGSDGSSERPGWAIDDVAVTGTLISTNPPTITSVVDNFFFADKGKQITINGSDFTNATVTIGGITGVINSNSGTQILVTFPPGRYLNNTLTVATGNAPNATATVTVNKRNVIPVAGGIDSHATIQSALDGLYGWYGNTLFSSTSTGYSQGAKTIEIYAGTYNEGAALNNSLNPNLANQLIIRSHSNDVVTINANNNNYGLYLGTVDYVQVTELQIKDADIDNIYLQGNNCEVSYVKSTGAALAGLKLENGDNHYIHHNLIINNVKNGLHIINSDGNDIINNTIANNKRADLGTGTLLIDESFEGSFEPAGWSQYSGPDHIDDPVYNEVWYKSGSSPTCKATFSEGVNGLHSDFCLQLPTINLTTYIKASIDFHYDLTGNTSGSIPKNDSLRVEISTNGGGSWSILDEYRNDNNAGDPGYHENIDISSYVGGNINIRFRYRSRFSDYSSSAYIDSVIVEAFGDIEGNGVYISNSSSNVNVRNNIITGDGSYSTFYAMKSDPGTSINSSYNLYYGDGNPYIFHYNGSQSNTGPMSTGDITGDPEFRNISSTDYHINSEWGTYTNGQWPPVNQTGGAWTNYTPTSPALDAGDPNDPFVIEPADGGRINQGCYGNTVQASKTDITGIHWTGNSDSDWNNTGNWENANRPTATDNAIIPNDCSNYPNVWRGNKHAECNNLIIENNASVNINKYGKLTVHGTVTNNAGAASFTIKSVISRSGSLIAGNNFPATVERYITGDQWHLMFSPLQLMPTSIFTQEGSNTNNNIYSYNETNEDYWNATEVFGTSGWTPEAGSATLRIDKGYYFNRNGLPDKIYEQTGGDIYTSAKTFNLSYTAHSGTPPSGGYTNIWSGYDGWNLVGNPYTSAIDWDNVPLNGVEAGTYIFDGINYQYYMQGNSSANSPYDAGITLNAGSRYIAGGQGFMVKVNNTGSTHSAILTLPVAAKVHNTILFVKDNIIVPNLLKLNIQKDDFTDELVIRTLPDTYAVTEGHDAKYDAYKLFAFDNSLPQIFSRDDYSKYFYSINALPEIKKTKVVSLGLYIGSEGQYSINLLENNFKDYDVYLYDIKLDKNIKFDKDVFYTFKSEAGTIDNRFEIIFNKVNSTNIEGFDENDVIIYPNPSSDFFNIYIKNQSEKYRIELSSVTGNLIYQSEIIDNDTYKLDAQHQSSGIYFLKIIFENKRELNRKIIIK